MASEVVPAVVAGEVFGNYRVRARLGAGAMGEVHEAYDTARRRVVALKRMTGSNPDPAAVERFRRESRLAASLSSPHVVPVHGYGVIDGRPYIDMGLVRGTDLARLLADSGALPVARAVRIIEQVAHALDSAHARGLVHRDVKPSNVLVGTRHGGDFVHLADFGIVHVRPATGVTRLTATGLALGTPAYMAPEQCLGEDVDARTDVYALGCVLFEMLTGRPPFLGGSFAACASAHLHETPPAPSSVRAGLPRALDDVVLRALAKDRDHRPASTGALAAELRRAIAPRPVAATPAVPPPIPTLRETPRTARTPGTPGRRPWHRGAVHAAVLAVPVPVLGVITGVLALRRLDDEHERGRALAWTGVVVGGVLTAALALFAVWLVVRTPAVSSDFVETVIATQTGVAPEQVNCVQRLPARLGASASCTVLGDGNPQLLDVTVTGLNPNGTAALRIVAR